MFILLHKTMYLTRLNLYCPFVFPTLDLLQTDVRFTWREILMNIEWTASY